MASDDIAPFNWSTFSHPILNGFTDSALAVLGAVLNSKQDGNCNYPIFSAASLIFYGFAPLNQLRELVIPWFKQSKFQSPLVYF